MSKETDVMISSIQEVLENRSKEESREMIREAYKKVLNDPVLSRLRIQVDNDDGGTWDKLSSLLFAIFQPSKYRGQGLKCTNLHDIELEFYKEILKNKIQDFVKKVDKIDNT